MRALAAFVLSGRGQAALVATALALLSLLLPPASYLAAAVIGLVTLRQGWLEGAVVGLLAGLVAGVLCQVALGTAFPVLALAGLLWIPVWLLAQVLRRFPSQGAMLGVAGLAASGVVLLIHALPGSPAERWRALLEGTLVPALAQQGIEVDAELVGRVAEVMTGVVAAAAVLGASLSLFIARWWQALLFNPGGFGAEFRDLRIDRRLGYGALLVLGGLLLLPMEGRQVAAELLLIVLVVYTLQGLAVAHALLGARRGAAGWLAALYVGLVLLWPYPLLVLGGAGLVDTWVDFRRRGGGVPPPFAGNADS
jgi:hypothetical protein